MPEVRIIILIDGGGAKPNAVAWLKRVAEKGLYRTEAGKTISVMNMSEFVVWANSHL